jgi:hypothetical protein
MPSSSPLMGGERRGQSTLALAAAALCAVALVGATASWAQVPSLCSLRALEGLPACRTGLRDDGATPARVPRGGRAGGRA